MSIEGTYEKLGRCAEASQELPCSQSCTYTWWHVVEPLVDVCPGRDEKARNLSAVGCCLNGIQVIITWRVGIGSSLNERLESLYRLSLNC